MSIETRATIEDLYKEIAEAEPAIPVWRMPVDDVLGVVS